MDDTGTSGYRRFESLREYEAVTNRLIARTQRTLRVFDRSLSRQYNTPERFDALNAFLRANRMNRMLAVVHDASGIERDCPRLMLLHKTFGSAIEVRQTLKAARHVYDPFVLADENHYVHRFHYDRMRAAEGIDDVNGASELLDRFAQLWDASAPVALGGTAGL